MTVDEAIAIGVAEVKPSNMILDGGEATRIKLVDFGIARTAADADVLTRTGVLIGSPLAMAQLQAISARHDLAIHEIDDGAMFLEARDTGAAGRSIAATRAAIELRR